MFKRILYSLLVFLLVLTNLQSVNMAVLAQDTDGAPDPVPTSMDTLQVYPALTDLPDTITTSGNPAAQVLEPLAVDETPFTLVPSGVTSYTLSNPKLFWHTGVPICPPAGLPDGTSFPAGSTQPADGLQDPAPDAALAQYAETINRIAERGSIVRTLYSQLQNCSTGQILSNLAADQDYIYFFNPTGLMRLSTLANVGDAPQIMNALVKAPGEVLDGGDRVFYIATNSGGSNTKVGFVWKNNNQRVDLVTPGGQAYNLAFDGDYLYYTVGGTLYRYNITTYTNTNITSGVTGFYPEGRRLMYCTINPFQCFYSHTVFIAKGRSIYTYSNNNDTLTATPIYTSTDTSASIYALVSDLSKLYFYERRTLPCSPQPCFSTSNYVLMRTSRSGTTPEALYTYGPTLLSGTSTLKTSEGFLYWQEDGKVKRLPNDVAALPVVNLQVTGMEVTQGIQNNTNSVLLIKGRRTFVRVFVKSAGTSVPGVTATLSSPSLGLGPLLPVNTTGTKITVRPTPDPNAIEQSFLFELPWSWVSGSTVNLQANVNPYRLPLEPDYNDNQVSVTLPLNNSPTLSVEFFRLNYTINDITYRPRISEDVLRTYSWIMRAYPIAGTVGGNFKPRLWDVDGGTKLGDLVRRVDPVCTEIYDDEDDDVALCASYVTNTWLWSYRIDTLMGKLNVGLNPNAFYYGMISDASNNFPRGQARYDFTSVGPTGTPGEFFGLGGSWDTDGTYADWYAAHEIGHSLGRAHPIAGSDNPATEDVFENCRHSRSDLNFPYGNTTTARAPIGVRGFDAGDAPFGIARAVLPANTWNDVMSYCVNQWISDYTYTAMYNFMQANPSQMAPNQENNQPQVGDWLAVSGVINPAIPEGAFSLLKRLDSVINTPVVTPGAYRIRLFGAAMNQLSSQDFVATQFEESKGLSFALVVPFVSGARFIELSQVRDGLVLALEPISANPPVVSNVALQGAPNPVNGVVTLTWIASDPDNDPLSFDVLYSVDNGASFQPAAAGIPTTSMQLDTSVLGGSTTARLRVVASDGVHTASADSAPFSMASKPPTPYILDPEDGKTVEYGQLVNFSGLALDAQDSLVPNASLQWLNASGAVLATGAAFSSDTLPVGANLIRLRATNSKGLSAEASVTVNVHDDLSLPGPTLIVSPHQVGWQINTGETTIQTAQISVSNSGGGTVNWTAADDAPWLSLDLTSGSIGTGDPQTVTLSANPASLADGVTHTAIVTITKPANGSDPEQVVTVLVTLSVGDVRSGPPPAAPAIGKIYMPLVVR